MKLYKFRSLDPPDYTLDILLHERLYCARHQDLNDPFEGLFSTIEYRGGSIVRPVVRPIVRSVVRSITGGSASVVYKSLDELPSLKNIRVCSLSLGMADIRMWSHYAGSHTGCAIEINIPDNENLHQIEYATGLRRLTAGVNDNTPASDVLSFKTDHWAYEKEYRFITNEEFVPITGSVTAVFLGIRVREIHRDLILKIADNRFPVFSTKINRNTVAIEKDRRIGS